MFEHDHTIKKHTPKLTEEELRDGYAYIYLGDGDNTKKESELVLYLEFEPTTHEVTFIETKGRTKELSHVWVTEDRIEELEQSKIRLQEKIIKVVEDSKYDL